jgi:FkbM family methyltransferase
MLRIKCRGAALVFRHNTIDICRANRVIRIAAKHFPYAEDMARNFESYFSQVNCDKQAGLDVVDYSGPKLHKYSSGLEFEIASIPEETEAIEAYFRWYLPTPGDTVFDVGAYCGVSTYVFSQRVGATGRVVAFEPDPLNHSLLLRNIERHELRNVIPVRAGIAGSSETASFCCEGTMGSSLKRQLSRATVGSRETIQTFTLADACGRFGIPAFAKIDIEGSEIEMLSAAQNFLAAHEIQFALDTNHWIQGELTNKAVEELFFKCGYEAESSAECGSMITWARPKKRM